MDRNQEPIAPQEKLRDQRPLASLKDLIQDSVDTRGLRERLGLPHPLSNFANDDFQHGVCADFILECIQDTVFEEPESARFRGAKWFLLESERAYFYICSEAGIDARRLRTHLRLCELLRADEMDGLIEERWRCAHP
jgi:hypothetical protein